MKIMSIYDNGLRHTLKNLDHGCTDEAPWTNGTCSIRKFDQYNKI